MVPGGLRFGAATLALSALSLAGVSRALAQSGAADVERRGLIHGGARPPRGFYEMLASHPDAFEFKHGWLERGRAVRKNRQALRAHGQFSLLNAAPTPGGPAPAATVVSGTLRYPTFMVFFANTSPTDSAIFDSTTVANRFWGTTAAPPYSITTYYKEISVSRLTVTGDVIRRGIRVSQNDTTYSGPGTCRGLCGSSGVPNLIRELILHADSTVDFSQYADPTTGYVPAIVILDPQVGGECYQINSAAIRSIWAHRYAYSGWTGLPMPTNDPWPGHAGQFIKVDDYIIQGGQGGQGGEVPYPGCGSGYLAPIGTITHETGHLFGLPDLYDTSNQTEGLGRWELMSAGNERVPWRPAHMSAWSLATLGWITETPVSVGGTIQTGPIETTDTAFVLPVAGTSEYFLVENRQPLGSDSALYGPGLLIYHADTALIQGRLIYNNVNALTPHGLALVQADGRGNLDCAPGTGCNNRGDGGDPYPGSSVNTAFGFGTSPAANKNSGAFSGVVVDSIRQMVPNSLMSFRVRFGSLTVVTSTDTNATIVVDGSRVNVYRNILADGSSHTVAADSSQVSANGRTQYLFVSWSDGGTRSHMISGAFAGASYVASLSRKYLVRYATMGTGTVSGTRTIDPANGTFLVEGDSVTLTAAPGTGQVFLGWTGDTTSGTMSVKLRLTRPWNLTASFQAQLAVSDTVLSAPVVGAAYTDTLRMAGGTGSYAFSLASGMLPPGLSLLTGTGVITGTPTKDSTYSFTVQVTSGVQVLNLPLRLVVTVPALVTIDVVNALLTPNGTLTPVQLKYLDIIGNNNGRLDVGDFVAWLDKTGNAVSAETMRQVLGRAKR